MLDKDHNGYINLKELVEGFQDLLSQKEIKKILKGIDVDHNGAINYIEFIAATLSTKIVEDKKKLKDAFNSLDKDQDGLIDAKEL